MIFNTKHQKKWSCVSLAVVLIALFGCDQKEVETTDVVAVQPNISVNNNIEQATYTPIEVQHKLGVTVIERLPQRVVALDMNEVDFLDQLGVPVAGMPKDFIPHFLSEYKDSSEVQDVGSIVQPNIERVHGVRPDLILMTSLQAKNYKALTEISPVIHFDVDYRDSQIKHIEVIKAHLLTLGKVFGKEELAHQKIDDLDNKIDDAKRVTQGRSETALVVLHNNGAFRSFGLKSRYGFIFSALGVKSASSLVETGLHGQPISSEFIQQANPDIIYIVDRTAVMENRPVMNVDSLSNPLLRQTKAWKNERIIFVDAEAWYVTAASPTSLKLIIDDVMKGY